MTKNRYWPVIVVFVCVLLVCAHAAFCAAFKQQSAAISDGFSLVWSVAAMATCLWHAVRGPASMRRNWGLLSLGLMAWVAGILMSIQAEFFIHASPDFAAIDDLLYFFYAIPVLLAIASQEDRQSIPVLFWLDGILAIAVGLLAYIALFEVLPFSGGPRHPMPVQKLVVIYDVEDFTLAAFATARLLVSARRSAERQFFTILVSYAWVYAIAASIYNHIEAVKDDAGAFDALVDVPFVLLIVATFFWPARDGSAPIRTGRRLSASFIDNARPVLLGLALVALSVWIAQFHLRVAITAIFGAFVVYGIRSAMLQNRFVESEAALEQARDRLEQLALQDGLTGIPNRRCFDQRLKQEWARARRTGTPLSLLLIDIDHFKKLNDTHGHLAGDESLIQVARTLQSALNRPGDLLARYGGEEFAALLPETGDSGAINVAERLQQALRHKAPPGSIERQVTISIGGTTWRPPHRTSPDQIIDTADRALYQAKQNGRDRIEYLHEQEQNSD